MMPIPNQVWLVVEPIDMRAGINGLSQRIQSTLGRSPCDGSAYAFRNRRLTRLKLLIWDGTGVWLCQRRLHQGHFTWPRANTPVVTLMTAEKSIAIGFYVNVSELSGRSRDLSSLVTRVRAAALSCR